MFKEMTHDDMMTVDGGYTGYNERPENFDSDKANTKEAMTDLTYVAGSGAILGAPYAAPIIGYAVKKANDWINNNYNLK